MKLYDEAIARFLATLEGLSDRPLVGASWPDGGKTGMVLRSDMAFELGGAGDSMPALGCTIATSDPTLVKEGIHLVGKDLGEISSDLPYGRVSLVLVDDTTMGDGNLLYNAIKKLDGVRYHVNPEGFMTRVSLINGRESARVSREALKKGISFAHVGGRYGEELGKDPKVKAVATYFITDPLYDYKTLGEVVKKTGEITKTIDHMMKNVAMDCKACNLQEVCEEVEGMRELHFGLSK